MRLTKKALIVTTISGFLPQFEMHHVKVLQDLGYEVLYASNFDNPVYPFDQKELEEKHKIRMFPIRINKSPKDINNNYIAQKELAQIIDSEEVDLIHCNNPMGGVVGRIAAARSKIKPYVIYTAHGFHFYKGAPVKNQLIYYSIEKLFARKTDCLITINQEDLESASKFRLKEDGFVRKISGVGVDMKRFCPRKEERQIVREELGIPENAFHIVTAAELNDNKNQKSVIKAISLLDNSNIYYTLCGEGPNRETLQKQIDECGLKERIKLIGFRPDMDRILQSADCFVFPSIREGLGIAAVEALACGVPLIAADNRGTREYARPGVNAIVVPALDVSQYAKAIKTMKDDEELRYLYASNARESVKDYCKENNSKMMYAIYSKIDMIIQQTKA